MACFRPTDQSHSDFFRGAGVHPDFDLDTASVAIVEDHAVHPGVDSTDSSSEVTSTTAAQSSEVATTTADLRRRDKILGAAR